MLSVFSELAQQRSWWDSVDPLASLVGKLLLQYPDLRAKMWDWAKDDCMWIRRVALIHQLTYKEKTDEKMLFELCKQLAHEEEFFIRKAIGWCLRQYSKTKPAVVRAFINENTAILSELSKKEAGKYC